MIRRELAFGLLLVAFSCGDAVDESAPAASQTPPTQPGVDVPQQPKTAAPTRPVEAVLFMIPERIELGILRHGSTTELSFELENRGKHPLSISRVLTSCKCLKMKAESRGIMPGKKVKISGTLSNTRAAQSQVNLRVTVRTSHPSQREIHGFVNFWSETIFIPKPRRLDLSGLNKGEEASRTLEVSYIVPKGQEAMEIRAVVAGGIPVQIVSAAPRYEEGPQSRTVIHEWQVQADTSAETPGRLEGAILCSSEGFRDIIVPVAVQVVSTDWYVDSQKIHLGVVERGGKGRREFKVFYTTAGTPNVSASTTVEGLQVSAKVVASAPKPHVLLTLEYQASDEPAAIKGVVALKASFSEQDITFDFGVRVR